MMQNIQYYVTVHDKANYIGLDAMLRYEPK